MKKDTAFSLPLSLDDQKNLLKQIDQMLLQDKKNQRKIKQLEHSIEYLTVKCSNEGTLGRFSLQEKEKQILYNRLLLESFPSVFIVFDTELRYAIGTGFLLASFLGFSDVQELNGIFIEDLFNEVSDEHWVQTVVATCRSVIQTSAASTYKASLTRENGKKMFLDIAISPAVDDDGLTRGCVFLMHDITELTNARDAAENVSKAKSDFLAQISHEIRTPMNAICGMSNLLSTTELSRTQKGYTSTIIKASDSLLQIINDILDFSKIGAGKLELSEAGFSIIAALRDVVTMIAPRAYEKSLIITVDIPPDMPRELVGDEMRVKQILLNLANNAVKYTHQGSVALCFAYTPTKDGIVFETSVLDTGVGIKKDDLDTIFSAFARVDSLKHRGIQGTGLGLSISRQLASAMGGEITVSSEYGKGSKFTLRIPLRVTSYAPIATMADKAQHTVLLTGVGKELAHIGAMLRKLGVWCLFSESIDDAMLLYLQNKRITHVIVSDCTSDPSRASMISQKLGAALLCIKRLGQGESGSFSDGGQELFSPVFISDLVNALENKPTETADIIWGTADASNYFQTHNAKVLVVDDNEINLLVVEEILRQYGIYPDRATGGAEAVALAAKKKYDLIFMDHMMPDMDGIEAARKIRSLGASHAGTPIIALTANALVGMREFFMESGMTDYLSKPIAIADMARAIKKWLPADKLA